MDIICLDAQCRGELEVVRDFVIDKPGVSGLKKLYIYQCLSCGKKYSRELDFDDEALEIDTSIGALIPLVLLDEELDILEQARDKWEKGSRIEYPYKISEILREKWRREEKIVESRKVYRGGRTEEEEIRLKSNWCELVKDILKSAKEKMQEKK